MANSIENFWDRLSTDEANFVQTIMGELCDQAWSTSILASIRDNGGITQANKDRMFELRFGYALDRSAVVPRYEIPGEGGSTIDFDFTNNGQRWRVELVRLGETQAVKDDSIERRIATCLLNEFPKQLNEAEFQSGLIVFPARN
jgi:hypothetical protein